MANILIKKTLKHFYKKNCGPPADSKTYPAGLAGLFGLAGLAPPMRRLFFYYISAAAARSAADFLYYLGSCGAERRRFLSPQLRHGASPIFHAISAAAARSVAGFLYYLDSCGAERRIFFEDNVAEMNPVCAKTFL